MPEFLADGQPIATKNSYVPQLTLGPAPGVKRINLSVLGANGAIVQCWRYQDASRNKFSLEQIQRVFAGQSIGIVFRGAAGIQIASSMLNQSTTVVGELVYGDLEWDGGDIEIDGGTITSAVINSSGGVTPPPPSGVNVQHNGVLVGTEPTLDLIDGTGLVWAVVDDSGNTRITVTPSLLRVTGIIPAAGTTPTAGTGFTYTHTNGTGIYTFTLTNPFATVADVQLTLIGSSGLVALNAVPTANGFVVTTGANDHPFTFVAVPTL